MKKLILFLFPLLLLCGNFVSCSDGEKEEQLVKSYGYKLNCEITNPETNEKENFHRVKIFNSVDNGDGTYNVKEHEIHFFATSNSDYAKATGSELCKIVINGNAEYKYKSNNTLAKDVTETAINPTTKEVERKYLFSAGLEYVVYYYF